MGLRKDRMADEIRDLIAQCFTGGQMSDPRLENVTITAVKLTPDLQLAYVYYRPMVGSETERCQRGLESAAGFLRKKLADSLEIRRVPSLKFFFDESIEHGSRIEQLLTRV